MYDSADPELHRLDRGYYLSETWCCTYIVTTTYQPPACLPVSLLP